jgi:hypothetical protein
MDKLIRLSTATSVCNVLMWILRRRIARKLQGCRGRKQAPGLDLFALVKEAELVAILEPYLTCITVNADDPHIIQSVRTSGEEDPFAAAGSTGAFSDDASPFW